MEKRMDMEMYPKRRRSFSSLFTRSSGRLKRMQTMPTRTDTSSSSSTTVPVTPVMGVDEHYLRHPQHKGYIFNVTVGRNYTGKQAGRRSVIKWVRRSHNCGCGDHIDEYINTATLAERVSSAFMKSTDTHGWMITLNQPSVIRAAGHGVSHTRRGIVEDYIHPDYFTVFNSNSGWALHSARTYNKVLQAFSHFSYVWSAGQMLLVDLQGAVSLVDKSVTLTGPTIVSQHEGAHGCTDLGRKGIEKFFKWHTCSHICRYLATPNHHKVFFQVTNSPDISFQL